MIVAGRHRDAGDFSADVVLPLPLFGGHAAPPRQRQKMLSPRRSTERARLPTLPISQLRTTFRPRAAEQRAQRVVVSDPTALASVPGHVANRAARTTGFGVAQAGRRSTAGCTLSSQRHRRSTWNRCRTVRRSLLGTQRNVARADRDRPDQSFADHRAGARTGARRCYRARIAQGGDLL